MSTTERLSDEQLAVAWRVIDETTPRDGTRILLAKIVGHPDHETALWWATIGHWSSKWNNWNDGIEPAGLASPTHWLPISAHGVAVSTASPSPATGVREALQEALKLAKLTESLCAGRGDDDYVRGVQEKIESALSALVEQP